VKIDVGIAWLLIIFLTRFLPLAAAEIEVRVEEEEVRRASYFVYVGQFSATRFNRIIRFDTDFQSSWIGVVGVTRELVDVGGFAHFEGEANFGQHWGMQSHQEVNLGLVLRWKQFPWDGVFDTSIALGSGVSYAFDRPPIEETLSRDAERILKYMVFEIAGKRPGWADWSGFVRIHHRSGVFGVVSEARGSNFVGLGVRRHF
jgi:hypothetical protein